MSACTLCAYRCGVDRTAGPAGACRSDATPRVFYRGIEYAGEEGLVPTHVVSLSGCNMSCSFCLTGGPSQNGQAGEPLQHAVIPGNVRSVTILGGEPTIHLDGALEIAARVPAELTLVWKTNAYASPEALQLLEGIPDVVLADYKFGNDECARRIAGVPDYTRVVRDNLRWAARTSRLIIRHLLMPGHLGCCLAPITEWIAREMPRAPFSRMIGYLPVFRAADDPELGRTNRASEIKQARAMVEACGLHELPWSFEPRGPSAKPDEIWIDRDGRVCVDSASSELVSLLKSLGWGRA
jgi:putative pyruvate formate lyase activating enzyme